MHAQNSRFQVAASVQDCVSAECDGRLTAHILRALFLLGALLAPRGAGALSCPNPAPPSEDMVMICVEIYTVIGDLTELDAPDADNLIDLDPDPGGRNLDLVFDTCEYRVFGDGLPPEGASAAGAIRFASGDEFMESAGMSIGNMTA